MTRAFLDRSAAKPESPHEATSPLREAMLKAIKLGDSLRMLDFSPAGEIMDMKSSATLLPIISFASISSRPQLDAFDLSVEFEPSDEKTKTEFSGGLESGLDALIQQAGF